MKIYNLAFLLLLQFPFASSSITENQQKVNEDKPKLINIVFKSTDGGQSWQDISDGLPENLQGASFFADDSGLHLRAGNRIYHSKPNSTAPFWNKEILPDEHSSIAAGNTGIETAGDSVFHTESGVMKLVESNGVLLATSQEGIIRSTDGGENWASVISEGGVGIAIEPIKGGFAAITYSAASNTRRVRTSYDDGKTWQPIDAGLPAQLSIASIIQVGDYLFCGHPAGIFRSSDKGKTWKLLLPSIGDKVFNLLAAGNVIYAIPRDGGC